MAQKFVLRNHLTYPPRNHHGLITRATTLPSILYALIPSQVCSRLCPAGFQEMTVIGLLWSTVGFWIIILWLSCLCSGGRMFSHLSRGLHGVYQVRFLHGVILNLVFTADCYVHIILKKFVKNINNCCENTCFTSYGKLLVAIGLVFGGVILFLKPLFCGSGLKFFICPMRHFNILSIRRRDTSLRRVITVEKMCSCQSMELGYTYKI